MNNNVIQENLINKPLSSIQKEILRLALDGLKDKEIASKIYKSKETVKYHKKMINKKLNTSTISQAIVRAVTKGMI